MRIVKYATAAGLIGLAVLHADAVGRIFTFATSAFRGAINVAPGKG